MRSHHTLINRLTAPAVALLVMAVVAYLVLFTVASLTRLRQFSPDSMNYVEVARALAAGQGIVQPALGFNEPHLLLDGPIPAALTSQPPGYPVLIALLTVPGIPAPDAALLLAALCYGVVLLATYLLGAALYDDPCIGVVAVVFLLFFDPLRYVASYAWSEPLGIAWTLLSLWCLARLTGPALSPARLALAAGVLGGLAFATRYAFLPLLPLALVTLLSAGERALRPRQAALYLLGWSIPGTAVVAHNLVVSGTLMGGQRNPSDLGLLANLKATYVASVQSYLGAAIDPQLQSLLLGGAVVLCLVVLAVRRRLREAGREVALRRGRYVGLAWALTYLGVLVYQRTQTYFDGIDERLVAPGLITLVLVAAALLVRALGLRLRYAIYPALILAALAVGQQVAVLAGSPVVDTAAVIAQSERLLWVRRHTTDRDLIIGDDAMDLPFYFHRPLVVSFSPYPYTDRVTYPMIVRLVHRQCPHYNHVYLVLRHNYSTQQDWQAAYGSFIADVAAGHTGGYPQVLPAAQLADASVFRITCQSPLPSR